MSVLTQAQLGPADLTVLQLLMPPPWNLSSQRDRGSTLCASIPVPSFYYLQLERTLSPDSNPLSTFQPSLDSVSCLGIVLYPSPIYFENGPNNISPRWAAPTEKPFGLQSD